MGGTDEPLADPWDHIPASTAIVFEFPQAESAWSELASNSQVWKAFRAQPVMEELHKLLACSFSSPQRKAVISPFTERPVLVALDRVSGKETSALVVLSAINEINRSELIGLFGCMDPELVKGAEQLDENNYTLKLDSTLGDMHVRIAKNVLLIASKRDLLEIAAGDSSFSQLAGIAAIRNTLGDGADAHIVMDTERGERYLDVFLRPDKQRLLNMPAGLAGLDLQIRPTDFLVSGVIAARDAAEIKALGQFGGPNRPARMVGKQASYLYSVHIDEPVSFTNAVIQKQPDLQKQLDQIRDSILIDVQQHLVGWIAGEVVIALDAENPSTKWTTARAIDGVTAKRAFDELAAAYTNAGQTVEQFVSDSRVTYNFPEPMPLAILGTAFQKLNPSHVGIYEDLVVFTSSASTLQKTLAALASDLTLSKEARAVVQFDGISQEHSTMIWCDLARSKELANYYVEVDEAHGDTSTLNQLGAFSMIIGREQNAFHHVSMQLQHAPLEQRAEPNVLWRAEIGAQVTRKPDVLEDHTSNARTILIQDVEGHLHFFSSVGEKLWERDIEQPIIGGVHQVDRYKNQKLQMLFNTSTHIHLIDRNGNDVEGYPISIKERTDAPLALMDYETDKNYRIIVSDRSGELHNYDLPGKTVTWDPIRLATGTQQAIRHIRVRSKDYLLAIERNGTLHLLDRKGQPRYESTLTLPGIDDTQVVLNNSLSIGECQAWWTDTLGRVWKGRFDSEAQAVSARHWPNYFNSLVDIDEDGTPDPIIAWADSVHVRPSANDVFTFHVPGTITGAPHVFNFGKDDKRIGITLDNTEGLYLFNTTGNQIDGMPKEGNTPFSISDLNADGALKLISVNQANEVLVHRCP